MTSIVTYVLQFAPQWHDWHSYPTEDKAQAGLAYQMKLSPGTGWRIIRRTVTVEVLEAKKTIQTP